MKDRVMVVERSGDEERDAVYEMSLMLAYMVHREGGEFAMPPFVEVNEILQGRALVMHMGVLKLVPIPTELAEKLGYGQA